MYLVNMMIRRVINNPYNFLVMKAKKVIKGNSLLINGRISLHGNGQIIIGNDVVINSSAKANPTAGGNRTYLRAEGYGKIVIGNKVGMSQVQITAFSNVCIEDNVLLGSAVKIWDTDFHSTKYEDRIHGDINPCILPILIKEGAFIGACSIILKGVTIGRHSIVGAGSVVTKNIPDGEIWAGNPAKFLRKVE